jgi:hypothetical protein
VPSLRLRLAERIGRVLRFSPAGHAVRLWIRSRPGEEDALVVTGTVVALIERGALVELDEPARVDGRELTRVLAVPREPGWGLEALWLAFIPVDAYSPDGAEPVGHWWMRLGRGR